MGCGGGEGGLLVEMEAGGSSVLGWQTKGLEGPPLCLLGLRSHTDSKKRSRRRVDCVSI